MMNIIFFGLGSIGQRHLRLLRGLFPDYCYYAFKRGIEPCAKEGVQYVYSWDEIEQVGADLAIISNPTCKHIETALACASKKINLFIEKPISGGMQGIKELIATVAKNDLKVMVGYNLRFHPVIAKARAFVENRNHRIISFSAYCGSFLPDWRDSDYKITYSGKKDLGGGVLLDLSHEIDYCKWIFGKPKKVLGIYGKYSSLEIDVEDNAEIILQYEDKVGTIHLDFNRIVPRRDIEIQADSSVYQGDLITGRWKIFSKDNLVEGQFNLAPDLTYTKQLHNINAVLKNNKLPLCDLNDAVETLQLVLAIKGEH